MPAHFLQYWEQYEADYALSEVKTADRAGSGQYKRRALKPGDMVWIVTVRPGGELVVIGRIRVGEIVSHHDAIGRYGKDIFDAAFHIIAEPGTEEEFRELSLTDIVAQLRFQSPTSKDRLDLSDGYVKPQQLQAMRKLTPASISLLESKWSESRLPSAPDLEQQIKSGAGFGNPETNKKVERAAVAFVTEWYKGRGWSVLSVEAKRCGYDLRCVKLSAEENVEVKGVQGADMSFIITEGEVRQAHTNPRFIICVVNAALSDNPLMTRYRGKQFLEKFDLKTLAYRVNLRV